MGVDFKSICGGNKILARLLIITVVSALVLWIISAAGSFFGLHDSIISSWLALPADPLKALSRPWTAVTYIVTHLSPLHLLFNTLWLLWFGRMLSDITRDRTILVLFLGGGIAGAIVYVVVSYLSGYPSEAYLTGDSAAVLSVMTATAVLMPNRQIGLFLLGEIKIKWIAIVCIAITLLGANGAGTPPFGAHIAGILFGLLWALEHKGIFKTVRLSEKNVNRDYRKKIKVRKAVKAFQETRNSEERLDELLDKIRVSGYDSLSDKEKTELNRISTEIES